ncbi:MAG: hypothetical protein KJ990_07840 [Proteobacteria bacterium]|nr:hypothetical protein [Pseudomonadota bacterium]MBU1650370.1 hypothetical protein [Pseudomonadota bacterium]
MLPTDFQLYDEPASISVGQTLKNVEREAIRATLEQTEGNKSKNAKLPGIAHQTWLSLSCQ